MNRAGSSDNVHRRTFLKTVIGGGVTMIAGHAQRAPGAAKGVDYSAYTFDKKGNLIVPRTPGFGLTLTT